jgi:hypothetical protein
MMGPEPVRASSIYGFTGLSKLYNENALELRSLSMTLTRSSAEDALQELQKASNCLKIMTDEVLKSKTGPGWASSRWDMEKPD